MTSEDSTSAPAGVLRTGGAPRVTIRERQPGWPLAITITLALAFGAIVLERNLALPLVINPDGISYAIIAEEYARGNVHNAINGYWGPALSWLIAGPVALGASALVSFRVLTVGILFACLYVIWRLTCGSGFRPELRYLAVVVAGLMMVPWSLEVMTPDLLMLLVMLLVFTVFNQVGPHRDRRGIVVLGLLGGVAFLVKPYGLLFFIVAFPVFLGYLATRYRAARSARLLVDRYVVGMAAFLMVALPWIAAMTWKYGHLTIGTSGGINLTLVAPATFREANARTGSSFEPPAFQGAVTGVEPLGPTSTNWNPLASASDLQHFVGNVLANAEDLVRLYWPMMLIYGAVVVVALVGTVMAGSRVPELFIRSLVFATVYVGLYCLVLVEVRYLWPAVMGLFLGALALVSAWSPTRRWLPVVIAVPMCLMLVLGPYWRPGVGLGGEALDLLFEPQATRRVLGAQARDDAEMLRPIATGARIASNDQIEKSRYLAYFLDASYYGGVVEEPADTTRARLEELDIDVFLYWGDPNADTPDYLQAYTLVETLENGDLRVYLRSAPGEAALETSRDLRVS